jgi:predicted RNA binding protein YcfA (HicA-like mRNA interferase family)
MFYFYLNPFILAFYKNASKTVVRALKRSGFDGLGVANKGLHPQYRKASTVNRSFYKVKSLVKLHDNKRKFNERNKISKRMDKHN